MRKGLQMIYCSGCGRRIWRKELGGVAEGWCHSCKKLYELLAELPQPFESMFFNEEGK